VLGLRVGEGVVVGEGVGRMGARLYVKPDPPDEANMSCRIRYSKNVHIYDENNTSTYGRK
jgi:hypothetical protein